MRFCCVVLMGLSAVGAGAAPAPTVAPGWDWSLPAGTKPAPYSGFVTWGTKRYHPAITVSAAAGDPVRSAPVTNTGDGERKTATFAIPELAARAAFPGKMDFRAVTTGPGDLTVTMARVIKSGA